MFRRRLEGAGRTVAAGFRPAGFRPFLRGDVGGLEGREVPVADLLGLDDRPVADEALACERPEDGAAVLARWLRGLDPEPDPLDTSSQNSPSPSADVVMLTTALFTAA